MDSDFQFANYFYDPTSQFNLMKFRAYSPNLCRWISRDPVSGSSNPFGYARNRPCSVVDTLGATDHDIPLDTAGSWWGVPGSYFAGGCYDLVNAALGLPAGSGRPDFHPTTQCWYGPNAQSEANKYKNSCSCGGVVWAKKGNWAKSAPKEGFVNPLVINYNPVDYVTALPSGKFSDISGPAPHGMCALFDSPPQYDEYPQTIWCATCKKR